MIEKSIEEFCADAKELICGAVNDDEFVRVKTQNGNAVVISEAEWDILRDALRITLAQNT